MTIKIKEENALSTELKIGIVGTGAIGRTHMERINERLKGAKVTACAEANEARLVWM